MMPRMRRSLLLPLALVPAVGCGFEVPAAGGDLAPTDAPPRDARAPDAGRDAAPDAAVVPPDAPPSWTVIETLSVPCTGQVVFSTQLLRAGVTYRLRASGECIANPDSGSRADAEYLGYNLASTPINDAEGVDNGLAIDDVTPGPSRLPDWGPFSATHTYEVPWIGTGLSLSAMFHEQNVFNNSGALALEILELK